jgi:NADPH:quinone reductase-like Zn-dependent oxidoreductase
VKAIIQDRYGSSEVMRLADVADPVAGDGEVLTGTSSGASRT